MSEISLMQSQVREWITGILPSRNPTKTCIKLVTESAELLDAISSGHTGVDSQEEVADILILLVDISDQLGIDMVSAFNAKMEKNRKREWMVNNGSLSHIE